jgi:ribonuclease HII
MNKILNCGVDEAGRGCVLGPLVLAACTLNEEQESFFRGLGVKDSKLLSKPKRESLFNIIKEKSTDYSIIVIPAEELNVLMNRYSLNEIEAIKTAEMVKNLKIKIDSLILDCPDTSPEKYKTRMVTNFIQLKYDYKFNIVSEHKADLNYMSVSCASVLAKVIRDRMIEDLTGLSISGYSSDPKTIDYLKKYIIEHKKIPPFARDKWETINNVMNDLYQNKIGWFYEKKS